MVAGDLGFARSSSVTFNGEYLAVEGVGRLRGVVLSVTLWD